MNCNQPRLFGINFSSKTIDELVTDCMTPIPDGEPARLLATANVDHIAQLIRNPRFRKAYDHSWRATIDGAPVFLYAKLRGANSGGRVTGADLFPAIVERLNPKHHRLFFIAASTQTFDLVVHKLQGRGFQLNSVAGAVPPFGFENDCEYSEKLASRIREHGTTHLFLGIGAPKSEIWIDDNRDRLGNCYAFCFGAGIDFYAGAKKRAPILLQKTGLEWAWRLAMEPRRLFKRYLIHSWLFIYAVVLDLSNGFDLRNKQ